MSVLKFKSWFGALLCVFLLSSCFDPVPEDSHYQYLPIYMKRSDMEGSLKVEAPKSISKSGKIYVYNDLLLVNEPDKGVHVFDNTNSSNPIGLAFIKVLGSTDIAVRNDMLYINQSVDLISMNISDPNNIVFDSRARNVFPSPLPPFNGEVSGDFVRKANEEDLVIVGWERKN